LALQLNLMVQCLSRVSSIYLSQLTTLQLYTAQLYTQSSSHWGNTGPVVHDIILSTSMWHGHMLAQTMT